MSWLSRVSSPLRRLYTYTFFPNGLSLSLAAFLSLGGSLSLGGGLTGGGLSGGAGGGLSGAWLITTGGGLMTMGGPPCIAKGKRQQQQPDCSAHSAVARRLTEM